jgi:uncharacterized protein
MKRGFAFFVFFLAMVCGLAVTQAQNANDLPLMGSEADPGQLSASVQTDAPVELSTGIGGSDNVFRILVVGDALAGGFGAGVTRTLEGDPLFEVANRFNESSGLARPEIYDWSLAAPKILTTREFDAVLVHVGVNDRQPIRTGDKRLSFKSSEWEAAYRQQVNALLGGLSGLGVRIYWVALPPMADPEFDADMQYLNGIFSEAVTDKGGTFIDLRKDLTAPDGRYLDRGLDEAGLERKLRSRDGITFMKLGNNKMGQLLVGAIKASLSAGQSGAQPGAVVIAEPGKEDSAPGKQAFGVPQFGQQGLDGGDVAFTPNLAASAGASGDSIGQSASMAEMAPQAVVVVTGSKADALFKQGLSPEPVQGRFDDFGIVAAP